MLDAKVVWAAVTAGTIVAIQHEFCDAVSEKENIRSLVGHCNCQGYEKMKIKIATGHLFETKRQQNLRDRIALQRSKKQTEQKWAVEEGGGQEEGERSVLDILPNIG